MALQRPNRVCQSIVQNYYVIVNQLCMHDERACGYLISAVCIWPVVRVGEYKSISGAVAGKKLRLLYLPLEKQRSQSMCAPDGCVSFQLSINERRLLCVFPGGVLRQRDHLHGRRTALPLALQRQSQSFQQHRRRPLQRMHRPADCWRWVTYSHHFFPPIQQNSSLPSPFSCACHFRETCNGVKGHKWKVFYKALAFAPLEF